MYVLTPKSKKALSELVTLMMLLIMGIAIAGYAYNQMGDIIESREGQISDIEQTNDLKSTKIIKNSNSQFVLSTFQNDLEIQSLFLENGSCSIDAYSTTQGIISINLSLCNISAISDNLRTIVIDTNKGSITRSVAISGNIVPKLFITTWNTALTSSGSSGSNQISLPLVQSGTYNFTVYWGDGSYSNITFWNQAQKNHTYSSSGIYNISINGTFIGFSINNSGDKLKLLDIVKWNGASLGNVNSNFYGAENMKITATDAPVLNETTSFYQMFKYTYNFNNPINHWNTSANTDLEEAFEGAVLFNQDLNEWDTSQVTMMNRVFYNATAFNGSISRWDTSQVTTMSRMFTYASSFNSNITSWNTSSVTNMQYLFRYAYVFNQNIGSWDVSSVSSMRNMFQEAFVFNQDLNNWNTSSATTMYEMFYDAQSFNGSISNWDTSNVNQMFRLFEGTYNFNQNISSWNTSSVQSMSRMFAHAVSFNQSLNNWDLRNVTVSQNMFRNASSFNQNISSWNTSKITNMNNMFREASSFDQNISTWDTDQVTSCSSFDTSTSISWIASEKPTFTC